MPGTRNRCAALLAATVVAAVASVALPGPASAATAGRCDPGEGVTVVVDFGALGGGVPIVCVEDGGGQAVTTIMASAGYDLDEVRTQPGFVCAINGKPDPDRSCARTPPANRYWGLFWSNGSSSSWSYASTGAHGLDIPEGGSVGWRWQNSNTRTVPGAPPTTGTPKPEPTKPTKPPKPTEPAPEPTKHPTTPAQPSGTPSDTPAGTPTDSPTAAATKAERAERAAQAERDEKRAERRAEAKRRAERRARAERDEEAGTPTGTPTDDAQVTADGPAEEETPLTPASATDDGNGPLTWVAGGAVLLLAVAAGVLARRRRG